MKFISHRFFITAPLVLIVLALSSSHAEAQDQLQKTASAIEEFRVLAPNKGMLQSSLSLNQRKQKIMKALQVMEERNRGLRAFSIEDSTLVEALHRSDLNIEALRSRTISAGDSVKLTKITIDLRTLIANDGVSQKVFGIYNERLNRATSLAEKRLSQIENYLVATTKNQKASDRTAFNEAKKNILRSRDLVNKTSNMLKHFSPDQDGPVIGSALTEGKADLERAYLLFQEIAKRSRS